MPTNKDWKAMAAEIAAIDRMLKELSDKLKPYSK